jgi:signal transduction histidine kinase
VLYVVASDVDERREVDEARQQAEADLRVRGELEALVTSMSSRFLDARSEELPATVRDALAGIARLHDVDRAYLVKAGPSLRVIEMYEEWWAEEAPRKVTPVHMLPPMAQRFWLGKLALGEVVCFGSLDESPVDEVREALAADDVQSILFLPLQRREATIGFFGFEARRRPCAWAPEEIALLRTVGELFVSATDRAMAEAALEATAAELEQRNVELERSNADLEHFASIVSHDLKSPLQVVRGFVDLLGRVAAGQTAATAEDAKSYVDAAQRGVTRMNALIDDLLAYSRAGRGPAERVPVDLSVVAREAVHDLSDTIDAVGADVRIGLLPMVEGDGSQLAQLFQNLVSNAVKFHRRDAPCVVEVSAVQVGADWHITVADNGIGISAADRERIFEMFTRAHGADRYPGSGVGLAVAQRVVDNHGGRIWVDDNPGGGSRVVFTIPVID